MQHLLLGNTKQTANGVTTRPGPTLDLNFAASLNTVDQVSGENLVTFNRSTSGTYFDSAGVLRSAAVNLLLRSEEFDNPAAWGALNAYISADATTAPNGTTTADKIAASGGANEHSLRQEFDALSGATYTFSCYLKASELSVFSLAFRVASLWPSSSNQVVNFDLTAGTLTVLSGTPTASIVNVGNGWWRCSITQTTVASGTAQARIQSIYDSDGSGIYIWGAQLEEGAFPTSYIPTTSTINSAPRFDHDPTTGESLGLLVEEQRTNLLLRSEEADSPQWNIPNSSITVDPNVTVSPDGSQTADKVKEATTTGGHTIEFTGFAFQSGTSYTVSFYAKAAERSRFRVTWPIAFTNRLAFVDISPGGYGVISDGGTVISVSPAGNDWFRVVSTSTCTTTTTGARAGITLVDTGTNVNYTGDGNSGIYIWGAQLEAGDFATSYIPTTTAAVTRSADLASITGTAFSGWYRQDEGTMSIEYRDRGVSGTNRTPYALSDGTANNRIHLFLSGTTVINNRHVTAGINTNPNALSAILNAKNRHAITSAVGSCTAASNGTPSNTTTPAAMPIINRLNIGINSEGTGDYLNSHVARITYYPVRIPNPLLQAITL